MMKVEIGRHILNDRQMQHMCVDKFVFRTKKAAKLRLRTVNRMRKGKGEKPLHIYKCAICGGYHFTSQRKYDDETRLDR